MYHDTLQKNSIIQLSTNDIITNIDLFLKYLLLYCDTNNVCIYYVALMIIVHSCTNWTTYIIILMKF